MYPILRKSESIIVPSIAKTGTPALDRLSDLAAKIETLSCLAFSGEGRKCTLGSRILHDLSHAPLSHFYGGEVNSGFECFLVFSMYNGR